MHSHVPERLSGQGLDFVVSEAKKKGIRLILSFVNNYSDYGGKPQYVAWANHNAGANLASEDDFFSDATIRGWFKDYIKVTMACQQLLILR